MHKLLQYIDKNWPSELSPKLNYCVALSGGIDSVVLLHILSQIRTTQNLNLSAMHINHGISANAEKWQNFCAEICQKLNIPLNLAAYFITRDGGQSLEAEARHARYTALLANNSDVIVLAHHMQDQIETVLSQLLRGSNIHNFAAMNSIARKNDKILWRPLLSVPKSQIIEYANTHKLTFIHDESNDDTQYLRNFLRHKIIPKLLEQDEHIGNKLLKTVDELQNSAQLIDELAVLDLNSCMNNQKLGSDQTSNQEKFRNNLLNLEAFKQLSQIRQVNLLSYFLRQANLPLPSEKQLSEFATQASTSRWERVPKLKINDAYDLVKQKAFILLEMRN